MRQYYRNGQQAAMVNYYYPHWVIQTPSLHGSFTTKFPVWTRSVRYLQELGGSVFKGAMDLGNVSM